jgi:hypothetical protein
MYWQRELAFLVTPKSGPLRPMTTLLDASRAITQDLPAGFLKKKTHWREAGWAVWRAADSGARADILAATEQLVQVLAGEGWMHRNPEAMAGQRLNAWLTGMSDQLRACIAAAAAAGSPRPALKLIVGSNDRAPPPKDGSGRGLVAHPTEYPVRRTAAS